MTIFFLSTLVLMACSSAVEQLSPCNAPETASYYTDVYPIIDRTCAIPSCHVYGSQYGNFKNADEVKKAASSGKLEFMIVTRQMPYGITPGTTFLTDCEITTIRTWIHGGASLK